MKTERRHELQTNALADWLGEKVETLKPYTQAVTASLLAVVVIVGVYAYMTNRTAEREAQGWDLYFRALEDAQRNNTDKLSELAETYADSSLGVWARISLADLQYARGVDQLFNDRTSANAELQQAVNNYLNAREQASMGTVEERATIGLARAYEAHNELDKAREAYQSIVTKWPNGIYTAEARNRLTDLDRPPTKQFYDWFAQRTQRSPLEGEPGTPGSRPPFSFDSMPQGSDLFPASSKFGEEKSKPATPENQPVEPAPAEKQPADQGPGAPTTPPDANGAPTPQATPSTNPSPLTPAPTQPPAQSESGSPSE